MNSKQQESAKLASSGSATPGTTSQPSPPLPSSAAALTPSVTAVASATDVKSPGLTDIKEECKTPGLASLSAANLAAVSTGFGFSVSLDKEVCRMA